MIIFEFPKSISCSSSNKDTIIKIDGVYRDCEKCSISVPTNIKEIYQIRYGNDILLEIEESLKKLNNEFIGNIKISNRKVRFLIISFSLRRFINEYNKHVYSIGKIIRDHLEPQVILWNQICSKRDNLQQYIIDQLKDND